MRALIKQKGAKLTKVDPKLTNLDTVVKNLIKGKSRVSSNYYGP